VELFSEGAALESARFPSPRKESFCSSLIKIFFDLSFHFCPLRSPQQIILKFIFHYMIHPVRHLTCMAPVLIDWPRLIEDIRFLGTLAHKHHIGHLPVLLMEPGRQFGGGKTKAGSGERNEIIGIPQTNLHPSPQHKGLCFFWQNWVYLFAFLIKNLQVVRANPRSLLPAGEFCESLHIIWLETIIVVDNGKRLGFAQNLQALTKSRPLAGLGSGGLLKVNLRADGPDQVFHFTGNCRPVIDHHKSKGRSGLPPNTFNTFTQEFASSRG